MKRLKQAMPLVLALFFTSCNTQTDRGPAKTQQEDFGTFLKSKGVMERSQGNDIQKKEFSKQFEADLAGYLDSVKLFVNWKGQIKDIKTSEYGNSTLLEFEIVYSPEKYIKITFECSHLVKTVDLESDYLFNEVKNMSNFSYVFVDGYIKRKADNSVYYYLESLFSNKISYPHYRFNVVKISKMLSVDTLSNNLQKAIVVDFEMIDLFRKEFKKEITKKEREDMARSLQFDSIQSMLLDEEKLYSQRFRQSLLNDFVSE